MQPSRALNSHEGNLPDEVVENLSQAEDRDACHEPKRSCGTSKTMRSEIQELRKGRPIHFNPNRQESIVCIPRNSETQPPSALKLPQTLHNQTI